MAGADRPPQRAQPGEPAWRERAPEYLPLFAPAGPRAAPISAFVSPLDLDAVLQRLETEPGLLTPPGAWEPQAAAPVRRVRPDRPLRPLEAGTALRRPPGHASRGGPAASTAASPSLDPDFPVSGPDADAPRAGDAAHRSANPLAEPPSSGGVPVEPGSIQVCMQCLPEMSAVSSLTNRIFLACTVVAALSLGFAFSFVNNRALARGRGGAAPRPGRGRAARRRASRHADRHVHATGASHRRPAEAEGGGRNRRSADGAAARRRIRRRHASRRPRAHVAAGRGARRRRRDASATCHA